jgi:uncharacterized membrane-anchored protein
MKREWMAGLFAGMVALQLGVPAWLIARHEMVLEHGRAYRFQTAPVDPADVLRGRFVALRFAAEQVSLPQAKSFSYLESGYAVLGTNAAGYAMVTDLLSKPPDGGEYIQCRSLWGNGTNWTVRFEFDRYYMNERLAPRAEAAYREHSSRSQRDACAVVRVLDGGGVVESLLIGDKPIEEFLKTGGR